jgi:hypothetical protein
MKRALKSRRAAQRYPPIPLEFHAPGGDVRIEVVPIPETAETVDLGVFPMVERTVRLKKGMRAHQLWRTLFHEMAHVWLCDSGLSNGLKTQVEEAICDAVASGMMQERFG